MTTSAPDLEPDEWTPSEAFRSVGRLTNWLLLLGVFAGVGVGIAVGAVTYNSVNGKAGGIIAGVASGLIAGFIALTPYMVIAAILDLLNGINERISWIADFLYEHKFDPDA